MSVTFPLPLNTNSRSGPLPKLVICCLRTLGHQGCQKGNSNGILYRVSQKLPFWNSRTNTYNILGPAWTSFTDLDHITLESESESETGSKDIIRVCL